MLKKLNPKQKLKQKPRLKSNPIKLYLIRSKIKQLEKRNNSYLNLNKPKGKRLVRNKEKKELEYNRTLLMPNYDDAIITEVTKKKVTPKIINNFKLKKHKYGEVKEENYKYALAKVEVLEDVCRINNWTTKSDWEKHNVPISKLFKELYKASVEYSDILKYYAKLRFDERRSVAR